MAKNIDFHGIMSLSVSRLSQVAERLLEAGVDEDIVKTAFEFSDETQKSKPAQKKKGGKLLITLCYAKTSGNHAISGSFDAYPDFVSDLLTKRGAGYKFNSKLKVGVGYLFADDHLEDLEKYMNDHDIPFSKTGTRKETKKPTPKKPTKAVKKPAAKKQEVEESDEEEEDEKLTKIAKKSVVKKSAPKDSPKESDDEEEDEIPKTRMIKKTKTKLEKTEEVEVKEEEENKEEDEKENKEEEKEETTVDDFQEVSMPVNLEDPDSTEEETTIVEV